MKILFVLEYFHPYIGGSENLFYDLTTKLSDQGYDVTVVTTRFDKSLLKKETLHGVKIIRVDCFNRYGFTFLSIPAILKALKGTNLIHTTTYNAALPAFICAKLTSTPVFITFHEVWGALWHKLPFVGKLQKNVFYYYEKFLLKLPFSKFIAVSLFTKEKLLEQRIPDRMVSHIYNGIVYHEQVPKYSPPKKFTFTFFGRLGISKGLDLLIPAAAKFMSNKPNVVFRLIIPKTPVSIFKKIMNLLDQYELLDCIELSHNLPFDQLQKQIMTSTCAIIPSYSEGFCFAAAETVAMGVPIISSNQGALTEVVSGRYTNMESQTVDALFKALQRAYNNDWIDTPVRKFHLHDSINAYISLYEHFGQKM